MEIFDLLFSASLRSAIGWTLIHSLWQFTFIGLALWVALKMFANSTPACKYGIALSALCAFAISGLITFIGECLPLVQFAESATFPIGTPPYPTKAHFEESHAYPLSQLEYLIPSLANVWLFGATLFLIRFAQSFAGLRALKQSPQFPLDDHWTERIMRLPKRLGIMRHVQIRLSSIADMPLTYGTFKPIILLPLSMVSSLPPSQIEAIIAHELAHVKRHDYAINLLHSILEVFFFYHPVYWWVSRLVREFREEACDDLAIQTGIAPKELALGLANVVSHADTVRPTIAMALGSKKNTTLDRIRRIMGYQNKPSHPSTFAKILMITLIVCSLGILANADRMAELSAPSDVQLFELQGQEGHTSVPQLELAHALPPTRLNLPKPPTKLQQVPALQPQSLSQDSLPQDSLNIYWNSMPLLELSDFPPIPSRLFQLPDSLWSKIPFPTLDSLPLLFLDSIPNLKHKAFTFDSLALSQWSFKMPDDAWLKRFEKEHAAWQQAFEAELKAWEQEFQPRMEQFQQKIDKWQREQQPKLEEFQRKMEIWQQAHQIKLEEKLHKLQQEAEYPMKGD